MRTSYGSAVAAAGVVTWTGPQAKAALADPAVVDELLDVVLLHVHLSDAPTLDPQALQRLLVLPCVTAVTGGTPAEVAAFDVELPGASDDVRLLDAGGSPAAAAELLAARAARNPTAARVLVQVLRATDCLPFVHALVLESAAYSTLLAGPEFGSWLASRPPARPRRPEGEVVGVRRTGDVLEVVLLRPHVRNAYSARVRDALVEALRLAVLDDGLRRIELSGAGPSFCSGADLDEFGSAADVAAAHLVRTARSPALLMAQLRDRLEVRVHGACVGAGVELAAFAGHVVADPATTFRLPELGMGILPAAGGTVALPRRIGRQRTALLALWGGELDATTALRWSLVDELSRGAGRAAAHR